MKLEIFMSMMGLSLLITCEAPSQSEPTLIVPCQGCEAIFEYKTYHPNLSNVDTLPGFANGSTRIRITGTIYQPGGSKPAGDVILYVYHTNADGIYAHSEGSQGWARRHGDFRGWIKTDADGKYTFYTSKPGSYPGGSNPAHIHPIVLEPNGRYYWIEEYLFADDPLLTAEDLAELGAQGGSNGIVTLRKDGDLWVGERDIILGENVPGYPK